MVAEVFKPVAVGLDGGSFREGHVERSYVRSMEESVHKQGFYGVIG